MTKKNFLFLSAAVIATTVAGLAFVVANGINNNAARQLTADSPAIESSILFSRENGDFKKIDDTTASISGTTSGGYKFYLISHNRTDISDTDYVACTQNSVGDHYISFATDENGATQAEFQAITGMKITVTGNNTRTFNAHYLENATYSDSSYEAVVGSKTPALKEFEYDRKFLTLFPSTGFEINVVSVELFYTCDPSGSQPEKELDHIGILVNSKKDYVVGDSFVNPKVTAYYSDATSEEITSGFTCEGYDMSNSGVQTVTVSYQGKTFEYQIIVRPSANHIYIQHGFLDDITWKDTDDSGVDLENSSFPVFAEKGASFTCTVAFKTGYKFNMWYFGGAGEDALWSQISEGGDELFATSITLTAPTLDIIVYAVYGLAE